MDAAELAETERQVAALLLDTGGDQRLLEAAHVLAPTLDKLVADDDLWASLAAASRSPVGRGELGLLLWVDWRFVLDEVGYQPPPSSDTVASELSAAASAAGRSKEPSAWAQLRQEIGQLARRIRGNAAAPAGPEDRPWWHRFGDVVGYATCVLRRVSLAALLVGAGKEAVKLATEKALPIMAFAGVSALPIVAAAVGGLLSAAVPELRHALQVERDSRARGRLDSVRDAQNLLPGQVGNLSAYLETVATTVTEAGRVPENADDMVDGVRVWAAALGLELANAWGFVAAHTASRGVAYVDAAGYSMGHLRVALDDLRTALKSGALNRVADLVSNACHALTAISEAVGALFRFLTDEGVVSHA